MAALSRDAEVALARRAKSGDLRAEEELTTRNLPLVRKIARSYSSRDLDREDLHQAGAIGLIQAVRRFDPDRGYKFCSYAKWWIHKTIGEAIVQALGLGGVPRRLVRELVKAHRSGVDLAAADVSDLIGGEAGSRPRAKRLVMAHRAAFGRVAMRLGDVAVRGDEEAFDAKAVDVDRAIEQCCTPEERKVLRLRFADPKKAASLRRISQATGWSRPDVACLERRAIAKLRSHLLNPAA